MFVDAKSVSYQIAKIIKKTACSSARVLYLYVCILDDVRVGDACWGVERRRFVGGMANHVGSGAANHIDFPRLNFSKKKILPYGRIFLFVVEYKKVEICGGKWGIRVEKCVPRTERGDKHVHGGVSEHD